MLMKWCKRGYVLAAILALASATIQAADVTITVNGKVVAKPCTVSTTNATVDLGDLYSFSLMSAGAASAWHDVALELTNCPVGTSRVTASFSGAADSTGPQNPKTPKPQNPKTPKLPFILCFFL